MSELGKLYKEYPGQDFRFERCLCGLMVLGGPCNECVGTPAAHYIAAPRWVRKDNVPFLAMILCLVIVAWFAVRVDEANPERGAMMELD